MLVLALSGLFFTAPTVRVHGASPAVSTVYISPTSTCCGAVNIPYHVNDVFGVNVSLNLASGQTINGFDIRINYTNPRSGISQGVLHATGIDFSSSIFSTYGTNVLEECIDGQPVKPNGSGCTNDFLGQVRLGEFVLGRTLSGPLTGQLFRVTFQVTGNGNSTFLVDQAQVVNPTPDPSNPGLISPQNIPVLKQDGIFSNQGVVAFFNVRPQDISVSPSVIPNQPTTFDANGSFVPTNSSMVFRLYSWDFGDNTAQQKLNSTTPVVAHYFKLPGNFSVSLKVWDSRNMTGIMVRYVRVFSALGNLFLTVQDQAGTVQRGNVVIRVFNSSASVTPFFNSTTDGFGYARFNGMTPGDYYLTFTGPGLQRSSKTETVIPGYTTQDTVHVTPVPSPPDYSGLIYLGPILGGIAIVTVVILFQRMRSRNRLRKDRLRGLAKPRSKR
jgi:hypothetical protein